MMGVAAYDEWTYELLREWARVGPIITGKGFCGGCGIYMYYSKNIPVSDHKPTCLWRRTMEWMTQSA